MKDYDGKLTREELEILRDGLVSERKIRKIEEFLTKYSHSFTSLKDVTGDKMIPSKMFYSLTSRLGYLMDDDPDKMLSQRGVNTRKKLNGVVRGLGSKFLANPLIIENREYLETGNEELRNVKDKGITLPDEPVLYTPNHYFADDSLASILASPRYSYLALGNPSQVYNTIDGLTAWLNGVILMNRKSKHSKQSSMAKIEKAMEYGADVVLFPEGIWNKTPNKLLLDYWHGFYLISKETGCKVVPMIHYFADPTIKGVNNPIHTVVDEPLKIDDLTEKEALELLREKHSYWLMLMMEKYGHAKREEILNGFDTSSEAFEDFVKRRVSQVSRYDKDIETSSHFVRKDIAKPEEVWEPIVNACGVPKEENEIHQMVLRMKKEDFQSRI